MGACKHTNFPFSLHPMHAALNPAHRHSPRISPITTIRVTRYLTDPTPYPIQTETVYTLLLPQTPNRKNE